MFIFWVLSLCSLFVHATENLAAANARLMQTNLVLRQALREINAESAVGDTVQAGANEAREAAVPVVKRKHVDKADRVKKVQAGANEAREAAVSVKSVANKVAEKDKRKVQAGPKNEAREAAVSVANRVAEKDKRKVQAGPKNEAREAAVSGANRVAEKDKRKERERPIGFINWSDLSVPGASNTGGTSGNNGGTSGNTGGTSGNTGTSTNMESFCSGQAGWNMLCNSYEFATACGCATWCNANHPGSFHCN